MEIDTPGRDPVCKNCKFRNEVDFLFLPVVLPCKEVQKEGQKAVNFDKEIGLYRCESYTPTFSYSLQLLKQRLIPFKNRLLRAAFSLGPSMPPF